MWIELHIDGEVLQRWRIEDMSSAGAGCETLEERVLVKEKLADMYLEHFRNYTQRIVDKISGHIDFCLVFESKGNKLTNEEIGLERLDHGQSERLEEERPYPWL